MASFNVQLNQRSGKDGLFSVFIRITDNRKHKRIKLDVRILEEHFNKKAKFGRWIRTTNLKHAQYNSKIELAINELRAKYEQISKEQADPLAAIKDKIVVPEFVTLRAQFDKYLEMLYAEASIGYYKQQASKLNRFCEYFGEQTPLRNISTTNIADFKKDLLLKGLSGVTVNHIMSKISRVFQLAIEDGVITEDPFRLNHLVKTKSSEKVRLSDPQIEKLKSMVLKPGKDRHWIQHTRDFYLFSYYNAGVRVSDIIQLRYCNVIGDRLEYEMDKTGHKKSIKLNKSALEILDKYRKPDALPNHFIFPILSNSEKYAQFVSYAEKRKMDRALRERLHNHISANTVLINRALKTISDQLELTKKISFHTSRHSFADKARRMMKKEGSKVTILDIKNALGHTKLATTEGYINTLDYDSMDDAMDSIFD